MKAINLKLSLLLVIGMFTILLLPKNTFANGATRNNKTTKTQVANDKITVSIDKNTKDEDFDDIIKMLNNNGIKAEFIDIKRNDSNEITSIKINLTDKQGNRSSAAFNSNLPIKKITLGSDNGFLFIKSEGNNSFGLGNLSQPFNFDEDNNHLTLGNHTINFEDIRKKMQEAMASFDKNMLQLQQGFQNNSNQKYHFVDNPDIQKLILIDGKPADFKTLDTLAKTDKLSSVDFLKPETAMSLYGKKAKDGAIIVTTK